MRQEKKPRRWPWIVVILVLLGIIAALGYGYWSKLQAEQKLPVEDGDNPPPYGQTAPITDESDPLVDESDSPWWEPPFHTDLTGVIEVGEFAVSPEHLALMEDFMSAWYTPLAEFGSPHLDALFTKAEDADIHADALRTLIAIRRAALTDLRMNSVDYVLTVTDVEDEDGYLRVEAVETTTMRFAATPDTDSVLYDLPHIFIFDDDSLTIAHHEADDNPYFSYNRAEDSDYDAEFARILRAIERRQLTRGEQTAVTLDCDHPYDRVAAYDYLMAYCDERNPAWYAYDDVGGNCMNFGSQVLLAGGIPEDEKGDEEWYWDGQNDLDLSWINVGRFYDYCRKNEGFGLVADTEAGYYTGEVGDVLIVGFSGDHRHTTIISDIVKDKAGNTVDYLISCNTTNYRDFPASAYYYTFHRLVKIFGWNES